jgi:hypothetical protein
MRFPLPRAIVIGTFHSTHQMHLSRLRSDSTSLFRCQIATPAGAGKVALFTEFLPRLLWIHTLNVVPFPAPLPLAPGVVLVIRVRDSQCHVSRYEM